MAKTNTSETVSIRDAVAELTAEEPSAAYVPLPVPKSLPTSGLYIYTTRPINPTPGRPAGIPASALEQPQKSSSELVEETATSLLPLFPSEELRLDVDGYYPQMKASGRISGFRIDPAYWIADVTMTAADTYEGKIWYKYGNLSLIPYTTVKIAVARTPFAPKSAEVTFSGGGPLGHVRIFKYKSRYFHPINFEFDAEERVKPILSYDTGSHPNRPASLPAENLSIATVYRRIGFDVSISGRGDIVPTAEALKNNVPNWSDMEMHDAMQIHWSKFADAPQWALWVFFASLHEMGTSLGGIMFDDIGPNHRQGTALFLDSFIKNAPAGDPVPAAFVNRMIFWTACHEMGHSFNLAHSWQKSLGVPWIPLVDEPEARSFMNYPYNVRGGTTAFFSDFEYRFSDMELLFMRHAPFRFVQQGNADWFDHHAFEDAQTSPEPKFRLSLDFAHKTDAYEFLEPVVVRLTLRNISGQPQLVNEKILSFTEQMTLIVKKHGRPAREFLPFARRCWKDVPVVLTPGAEIKDSLFLAGRNGWDLAEPGYYTVQASLRIAGEDVVSQPVTVRVAPPKNYQEEYLAQDFFSEDVGRVMNFDGSRYLQLANQALWNVVDQLPASRAAIHSRVALAGPYVENYKELEIKDGTHTLKVAKAEEDKASKLLSVLVEDPGKSSQTLGQIDYDYYRERYKPVLEIAAAARRAA